MSTRYVVTCECGWTCTYSAPGRAAFGVSRHTCPEPAREHRRACRTCGWSGTYRSAAMADARKGIHACQRHLDNAAAQARGLARKAAVDKTPKPCLHKHAHHVHGTHACYVLDACRCPRCTNANRIYERDRSRAHAYGRWDHYVDAEPVRQHARELMAAGMGLKRIVATGAISQGGIWKLLYGKRRPDGTRVPSRRVTKDVAARVLALQLDLADGARVPAHGSVLRVRALVALGWSQSKLAARLGIDRGNFHLTGTMYTTARTATAVRTLYAELSMTRPPETNQRERIAASRSRNYAANLGWLPPLALDDDRLDDPGYEPWFDYDPTDEGAPEDLAGAA